MKKMSCLPCNNFQGCLEGKCPCCLTLMLVTDIIGVVLSFSLFIFIGMNLPEFDKREPRMVALNKQLKEYHFAMVAALVIVFFSLCSFISSLIYSTSVLFNCKPFAMGLGVVRGQISKEIARLSEE